MASKEVETEEASDIEEDVEDDQLKCGENTDPDNITSNAEKYLNSDHIKYCSDPKLKREKKKLEDLLNSYKKLISKLDSQFSSEEAKKAEEDRVKKLPEIYAILHPELYHNPREEEKSKLIQKFSKRQFAPVNRVIPPTCLTPIININDKRQEEKERFIKIISSCPARFHNNSESPAPQVKLRRPKNCSLPLNCPKNEREVEKERLSKILATSFHYRKPSDRKTYPSSFQTKADRISSSTYTCKQPALFKENMVQSEHIDSPVSTKGRSRVLYGVGEHEERRSQLIAGRRRELKEKIDSAAGAMKNSNKKIDKALSTTDLNGPAEVDNTVAEDEVDLGRKRCSSISTQTDPDDPPPEIHSNPPQTLRLENNSVLSPQNVQSTKNNVYYLSPREKLMSDLHGVSLCFPGGSPKVSPREDVQDIRSRQAAYAKALQEQIDEKRKLEEARKRREKEEEELIEQRIRLQQEKLESQLNDEEQKRHDWMAQRQSHEEVLRRRMLELELEAQELKKAERKKRTVVPPEPARDSVASRPLPPPQSTHSEPPARPLPRRVPQRSVPIKLNRNSYKINTESPRATKFEGLRMAPLLEADRQNILTTSALPLQPTPPRLPVANSSPGANRMNLSLDRERAEELLKAPLDFRIDRPPSPPIPAVKTRGILTNNTKVLENKWEVPSEGGELKRTQAGRENILTQLGAFRRQLHQEHIKLEARLQRQQAP